MSLKLAARLVTVLPYKIADLTAADTNIHIEDISDIVPKETKALLIKGTRMGGTGILLAYPVSGPTHHTQIGDPDFNSVVILPIKDQEIAWKLSIAHDDWDVYLFGYWVQKRTR